MEKKTLVICYSYDGNTELIGQEIAKILDADIQSIQPENEKKRKGFSKFLWGGSAVLMKKEPKLLPLDADLAFYNTLIIGTPVWAGTYAPPIRTLFNGGNIKGKKIAVYCCHEGGMRRTLEDMVDALNEDNTIISKQGFLSPKKNKETTLAEARTWAESLKNE